MYLQTVCMKTLMNTHLCQSNVICTHGPLHYIRQLRDKNIIIAMSKKIDKVIEPKQVKVFKNNSLVT